jgi:hypothetical protein
VLSSMARFAPQHAELPKFASLCGGLLRDGHNAVKKPGKLVSAVREQARRNQMRGGAPNDFIPGFCSGGHGCVDAKQCPADTASLQRGLVRQTAALKSVVTCRSPAINPAGLLLIQTMLNVRGAIPGQHFCLVSLVGALKYLDLFGAAFFRGHAIFRSDLVGVDQLLGRGSLKRNCQYKKDCG